MLVQNRRHIAAECDLGRAPRTIDAYARGLAEYLDVCERENVDPATANLPAIRSYTKVGFRPVGVMRQYERGGDGQFHDGLLMDLLRDELTLET